MGNLPMLDGEEGLDRLGKASQERPEDQVDSQGRLVVDIDYQQDSTGDRKGAAVHRMKIPFCRHSCSQEILL